MEQTDEGETLAPGWRAFVTNRSLDHDDAPNYQELDRAPDGVALPSQVWLYSGAPCAARATRPFRMVTRVGPVSEQLGVELDGCAKAADAPEETYGLVGGEDFSACAWTLVDDVAQRGGDVSAYDDWTPMAARPPIPAEIDRVIDHRPCEEPSCVPLWYVRGAGAFAYDVIQTWMKAARGPSCELAHDDASTILVRGDRGLTRLADADVGNQQLVGVFHDAGGARLAVLDDVGEYSIFTLGAAPRLAVHRVWFDKNEEDANHRSLAPYCGP